MQEIMFGAQTTKQSQRKHQDSMKGNPKSGVKRKTQKLVRFKIEKHMGIGAHVTHWQVISRSSKVKTEFRNGRSWKAIKSLCKIKHSTNSV